MIRRRIACKSAHCEVAVSAAKQGGYGLSRDDLARNDKQLEDHQLQRQRRPSSRAVTFADMSASHFGIGRPKAKPKYPRHPDALGWIRTLWRSDHACPDKKRR